MLMVILLSKISFTCDHSLVSKISFTCDSVPNDILTSPTFQGDLFFFICVKLDVTICGCKFLLNLCMCVVYCVCLVVLYVCVIVCVPPQSGKNDIAD